MGSFSLNYLLRRLLVFILTIWVATTLLFIIPRLAPGDPIGAMISRMAQFEGFVENADLIIESWRKRFGLDDPLHVQYLRYLGNSLRLDLGYSMGNFPSTVSELVGRAMPWTIGLLGIATAIFFTVGNLCGALLAWRRTPKLLRVMIPISMSFTSVPPALLSLLLVYVFGFKIPLFPIVGSYGRGMVPEISPEFIGSVLHHGFLPAMSIVLATFGFWALGMRGMMVTIEGEDYMILAQAKGLKPFYVLYRYMVRNAILPQMTALAVSIGTLINGSVLVEIMFTYNGMGSLIYSGINTLDFGLIQGTSLILIVSSALAVLIIDLTYPLIDPRISLEGR